MIIEQVEIAMSEIAKGISWTNSSIPKTKENKYDWDVLVEIYEDVDQYAVDTEDAYSDHYLFI